jgi:hypothetical protein
VNVDPDYIAPPGVAPQDAIDQGLPDAGKQDEPREADAAPDTGERRERDATQGKQQGKATPAKKAAAQMRSHISSNDK